MASSSTFGTAFAPEWGAIYGRRKVHGDVTAIPPADTRGPPENLVGLAFSGGGIRSATFNLGVLQALHDRQLLGVFDYLSTVSGGGFIGGWWSAWLSRPERRPAATPPVLFPDPERLEPERFAPTLIDAASLPLKDAPADGSRSAHAGDAIHHVRLFANYLTPRKGTLSADTWRAITIISRNLVLTWLVLLPIVAAATLAGQLYFTVQDDLAPAFVCALPDSIVTTKTAAGAENAVHIARRDPSAICADAPLVPHATVLAQRMAAIARPLAVALVWIVALTILWMLYSGGTTNATVWWTLAGFIAVILMVAWPAGWVDCLAADKPQLVDVPRSCLISVRDALRGTGTQSADSAPFLIRHRWGIVTALGIAVLLPVYGWRLLTKQKEKPSVREQMRNRIVRAHGLILVTAVIVGIALALAGFGHELVWFLTYDDNSAVPHYVRHAGGWLAVLATVASGLYTVLRAAPAAQGHDDAPTSSKTRSLVIAVAPVLVLLALVILSTTLGRALVVANSSWDDAHRFAEALVVGASIECLFALGETLDRVLDPSIATAAKKWSQVVVPVVLSVTALFFAHHLLDDRMQAVTYALTAGVMTLIVMRLITTRDKAIDSALVLTFVPLPTELDRRKAVVDRMRWMVPAVALLVLVGFLWLAWGIAAYSGADPSFVDQALEHQRDVLGHLGIAGLVFCATFTVFDMLPGRHDNIRAGSLVATAAIAYAALVFIHFMPHVSPATRIPSPVYVGLTTVSCMGVAVALAVALGWRADPNLLGMHTFYKARLTRAYLGASNTDRETEEITESAPNDDIKLSELGNTEVGAAYHIINTTLNLVGGGDLATSQRAAANFVLSRDICGSARTGYRRTSEYMGNNLSLGTAVAVSGAAASPNMGLHGVSSALAMLLALFNVRLGFWAPTPNQSRWRDRQPRLWPFYLLRESLSQTNELGAYSFITDGGHFDNTAVYALVERGCRYIVLSDCGADPVPSFSDIGDLVRRCRIDFGAEISLCVDPFLKRNDEQLGDFHYALGTIRYDEDHARLLGWDLENKSEAQKAELLTGRLLWLKPIVNAGDGADVRQYKMENREFPQQSTADQWYDEAQFESYRRLGYESASTMAIGIAPPSCPAPTFSASSKRFFDELFHRTPTAQKGT